MKIELHLDFETRSQVEISGSEGVGLHNYAMHNTTQVLMLAWAINDGEVDLWEPHRGPMPEYLKQLLLDPAVTIIAFNTGFERAILKYQLHIDIPVERFQDPQASARYLSLPANLDDVGMVLGLPEELRKDKRGDELIKLFSEPKRRKKKELKEDPSLPEIYFNDWNSHPTEWNEFCNYCKQDVRAEREVQRRQMLLGVFPLPERERKIWLLDQLINDRGMPTDRQFVANAFEIASRDKNEKMSLQNQLTGLENANSAAQLLPWVQKYGYPLNNLRKQNIELILKNKPDPDSDGLVYDLKEEGRRVLEQRIEAGSTSYKKLQAMLRNISYDNTLKNQFIYMGSSRCGRWSGNAVQLQNMARPEDVFEDQPVMIAARNFIYQMDYAGLKTFKRNPVKLRPGQDPMYSPLLVVKNCLRTVFVAPPGMRFNVCDLNAIETRVGAWVAQCQPLLQVFLEGRDPYVDFATKMYGLPYAKIAADLKSKDPATKAAAKLMRQIAKPGVLGAVYRLGPGGWGFDKNGDKIKTGLWGYAEAMGVDMTLEQAREVVKIFREAYKEIVKVWFDLENAVKDVLLGERTIRYIGPDNAIKIDKITFGGTDQKRTLLRIWLPSGRALHYLDAEMRMTTMPWTRKVQAEDGSFYEQADQRLSFTYYGKDQSTDQWTMIVSHGGKIFENIVQAIARDVLADKLLDFEAAGLTVVGHVHDEGICLTPDDPFAPGVLEMEKIMDTPVSWAPTLPLGSDGFEDYFYHK